MRRLGLSLLGSLHRMHYPDRTVLQVGHATFDNDLDKHKRAVWSFTKEVPEDATDEQIADALAEAARHSLLAALKERKHP